MLTPQKEVCRAKPFKFLSLILLLPPDQDAVFYSFDLREGAKHWMDKEVLGERAYFHSEKTGSFTAEGVEILQSYLQINQVIDDITGVEHMIHFDFHLLRYFSSTLTFF